MPIQRGGASAAVRGTAALDERLGQRLVPGGVVAGTGTGGAAQLGGAEHVPSQHRLFQTREVLRGLWLRSGRCIWLRRRSRRMWRMRSCPPTLDSSAFTWRPIVRWVDFSRGSSPRKPTAHSVVRLGREHLQHRARMSIRPFSGHDKIAMLDNLAARIVVTNLPGCIVRRHVSRSPGDAVAYASRRGKTVRSSLGSSAACVNTAYGRPNGAWGITARPCPAEIRRSR